MCKTIYIHESIFNNKSNDTKRINNYLNFLNKTNGQTFLKKQRRQIFWDGESRSQPISWKRKKGNKVATISFFSCARKSNSNKFDPQCCTITKCPARTSEASYSPEAHRHSARYVHSKIQINLQVYPTKQKVVFFSRKSLFTNCGWRFTNTECQSYGYHIPNSS